LDAATQALEQKAHKLAEEMYKNATGTPPNQEPPQGTAPGGDKGAKGKDGVVDAEFESN
jgi:hypothetical protein